MFGHSNFAKQLASAHRLKIRQCLALSRVIKYSFEHLMKQNQDFITKLSTKYDVNNRKRFGGKLMTLNEILETIKANGTCEVQPGVWISSQEQMISEQLGWEDDCPDKSIIFTTNDYWIQTNTGFLNYITLGGIEAMYCEPPKLSRKRRGKFRISNDAIAKEPEKVLMIMACCIVVRAESFWAEDVIEYFAISEQFKPVDEGEATPEYGVLFESGKVKFAMA